MSTKIFDIYKYSGTNEALIKFLQELRKEYLLEVKSKIKSRFHKSLTEKDIRKIMAATTAQSGNDDDMSSIVCVYYAGRNKYLHFFRYSLEDHKNNAKGVIFPELLDWHYQDQTDRPADISRKKWTNRRKLYDKIFNDYDYTPERAGLMYKFVGSFDIYRIGLELKKDLDCKNYFD